MYVRLHCQLGKSLLSLKVSESCYKSFNKYHSHALETCFESRWSHFFLEKFSILLKINHHFYHFYFSMQLKDNLAYQKTFGNFDS